MKKEKSTILILLLEILIPLFFFVFCPFFLYIYGQFSYSPQKAYEINWRISLPNKMKLLDDKRTMSFHGDGFQHTVYQVNKIGELKGFKTKKNEDIENFCVEVINVLEIEKKYVPDFTPQYTWRKYVKYGNSDMLVIIYFPDKQELHLFQKSI